MTSWCFIRRTAVIVNKLSQSVMHSVTDRQTDRQTTVVEEKYLYVTVGAFVIMALNVPWSGMWGELVFLWGELVGASW